MIDYNNLKAVYTVQWPFNHFDLEKKAYISEQIAKEKFEKKEYFVQVFFNQEERVLCINFEINFIRVTIYRNHGPYYRYIFVLKDSNYRTVQICSMSEKNVSYDINKDGFVIQTVNGFNIKDTKYFKRRYNQDLLETIHLNFNDYGELLKWIERLNIESFLEEPTLT